MGKYIDDILALIRHLQLPADKRCTKNVRGRR
jgi:hypothetical protein